MVMTMILNKKMLQLSHFLCIYLGLMPNAMNHSIIAVYTEHS